MTDLPGAPTLPADLKVRAVSGAALILVAAIELYVGGTVLAVSMALLTAGMAWECLSITGVVNRYKRLPAVALAGFSILVILPGLFDNLGQQVAIAGVVIAMGAVAAFVCARPCALRFAGLVAYVTVCVGGVALLVAEQRASTFPVPPLLILIPAVVGTDIGAYFTGRALGGPKLAPLISPNKTWSGAIGGVLWAVLAAIAAVWIGEAMLGASFEAGVGFVAAAAALLSGCSQTGDLAESWLKRRAGRKDSGSLIPGHGGLLDRFDGFMGAAVIGLGPWVVYKAAMGT
jgi:phosphatidate cytidylyltransferase